MHQKLYWYNPGSLVNNYLEMKPLLMTDIDVS